MAIAYSTTSSARASNVGGTVGRGIWRLEIDDQIDLGRRLDGEVARLLALKMRSTYEAERRTLREGDRG